MLDPARSDIYEQASLHLNWVDALMRFLSILLALLVFGFILQVLAVLNRIEAFFNRRFPSS